MLFPGLTPTANTQLLVWLIYKQTKWYKENKNIQGLSKTNCKMYEKFICSGVKINGKKWRCAVRSNFLSVLMKFCIKSVKIVTVNNLKS